jgi:hypothetical protein
VPPLANLPTLIAAAAFLSGRIPSILAASLAKKGNLLSPTTLLVIMIQQWWCPTFFQFLVIPVSPPLLLLLLSLTLCLHPSPVVNLPVILTACHQASNPTRSTL